MNNKFSFGIGVRNEMQSHINDRLNLMPRVGFTWTPWGNRTAIRGGYGLFYDWYESNLYDQTLRVNGIAQRDIVINGIPIRERHAGAAAAGGRIQASPDLKMPKVHQASIGIERQVTQNLSVQASYQMLRGRNQMRSININAPVNVGVDLDGNRSGSDPTRRSATSRSSIRRDVRKAIGWSSAAPTGSRSATSS